jgi:YbbR domain-containing protein
MASFKEVFRTNLGAKMLAFVMATIAWMSISLEPGMEAAVEAGVRYTNVSPGLELNPDQADRVTLIVGGPRSRMRQLPQAGLAVEVDLSRLNEPGERTFEVADSGLNLPEGLRLIRAIPSQLRLSVEERAEREVTVHANLAGRLPGGRELAGATVKPAKLRIAGPATRVSLVEGVTTDPIDLSQVSESRTFETTAQLPDPYLRFLNSPTVTVRVVIQ